MKINIKNSALCTFALAFGAILNSEISSKNAKIERKDLNMDGLIDIVITQNKKYPEYLIQMTSGTFDACKLSGTDGYGYFITLDSKRVYGIDGSIWSFGKNGEEHLERGVSIKYIPKNNE